MDLRISGAGGRGGRPAREDRRCEGAHPQLRKALGRGLIVTRAPGHLIRIADGELDLECFGRQSYGAPHRGPGEAAALLRDALPRGAVCRSPR
jgi:hypothetical protein